MFGVWRSPVARLLWEQEVPGSNPGAPMAPSGPRNAERDADLGPRPARLPTPFDYFDVVELSTPGLIVSPLEVTG
jgi:hypothetical protein